MVVKLLASKHTAFAFNDSISPLENERNNKPLNKVDNAEVPRILVPGANTANTHFFGGESITIFSMLFIFVFNLNLFKIDYVSRRTFQ